MNTVFRSLISFGALLLFWGCNPGPPNISIKITEGEYTNKYLVSAKIYWGSYEPTQMKVSSNKSCSGGSWRSASSSFTHTLSGSDGIKYISVLLKDKDGESTNCASEGITLDSNSPSGDIEFNSPQPVSSRTVSFDLSYQDNLGVSQMSLMESSNCKTTNWENVKNKKTITLSKGNGMKDVSIIYRDKAFNQSPCYTVSINLVENTDLILGQLHVEGTLIKDSAGNTVTLRGVNIADPQHLDNKPWERPGVSARIVAENAIENFNVNVIRVPIHPGESNYPDEGWFSPKNGRQKYFDNHIVDLVDYITGLGVYVIIDLHYISDYSNLQDEVLEFWEFMAPKYADNPFVIYEIFNEPIYPDNWNTWKNTIAQPAVDLIRSYAPDTLIIVGGPYWSSHMSGAATNPVSGDNLVYTAHVYSNQSKSAWEKNFRPTMNKFPLFVTEWGFEGGSAEHGTASGFGTPFLEWMNADGLSWTAWCFDSVWGPRMFDSNWNLLTGNNGMGQFVKDALQANP
jgi:hypothetical protein